MKLMILSISSFLEQMYPLVSSPKEFGKALDQSLEKFGLKITKDKGRIL